MAAPAVVHAAIVEQPTEIGPATIDASATAAALVGQPTSAQPVPAPAGAAPLPLQLPNTGDRAGAAPGIVLGIVIVLLAGGWLLRRRGARS